MVTTDWYHTFKELYEFRLAHLIALLLYCLFICPTVAKALFPYDGHTGADIIKRLLHV
jgi:hypothetical protein